MKLSTRMSVTGVLAAALLATLLAQPAYAQDEAEGGTAAAAKVWSNQADIGVIITGGNNRNQTVSLDNQLQAVWTNARFQLRLGAYRQTSDDITRLAFSDGDQIVAGELSEEELDQLRLYIGSSYQHDISEDFFWTAGASWDRDIDAGIESRLVLYAGVGNTWINEEDLKFSTEYTAGWERRDEEIDDPSLDMNRPTTRLAWDYLNHLFGSDTTVLTNNMDFFINMKERSAYRFINATALTMGLTDLLSLRTSMEFRYDNRPSLEEVDLFDSDPNVDPLAEIIGVTAIRKQELDSIFRFTLVFKI